MSFSTSTFILVSAVISVGLLWWGIWLVRTEAKRPAEPSRLGPVRFSTNSIHSQRRSKKLDVSPTEPVAVVASDAGADVAAMDLVEPAGEESETIGIAEAETVVIADVAVVKPREHKEKNV